MRQMTYPPFLRILSMSVVLFSACFMTGCSLLKPVKDNSPAIYTFSVPMAEIPQAKLSSKTLLVSEPQSAPDYDSHKMIYLTEPYRLQAFAKNQWADTPAILLQPLIAERLQATGHFLAVAATPFSGVSDIKLDTALLRLQQDFTHNPSQVELILSARLMNATTRRVIAIKRFEVIVPATANTPYAGVVATNQAVDLLLNQLTEFVVTHTK